MNGLGQQMQMGQMLQNINPLALYEAQQRLVSSQNKEDMSQQLAQGNFGAAGYAGMLGNLLGGIMNRKHRKATDSAHADYIKAEFEKNQRIAAQQKQEELKARAEKYRREDEIANKKHANSMELKTHGQQGTSLIQNAKAAGVDISTPEGQAFIKQQMSKSNAPVVNVNSGKTESVFSEALAKGNAKKFNEWESEAFSSNELLGKLGQMEQISQLQATGKVNEAMAAAGQWFGSEAGSNMQTFGAIQKDLMLDAASVLAGAMSDGEWQVLKAKMPDFGNDPRANAQIISILKGAAQRKIKRYEGATDFIEKNGKLQGFKPEFNNANRDSIQSQPTQTATNPQTGEKLYLINGQWVKQ